MSDTRSSGSPTPSSTPGDDDQLYTGPVLPDGVMWDYPVRLLSGDSSHQAHSSCRRLGPEPTDPDTVSHWTSFEATIQSPALRQAFEGGVVTALASTPWNALLDLRIMLESRGHLIAIAASVPGWYPLLLRKWPATGGLHDLGTGESVRDTSFVTPADPGQIGTVAQQVLNHQRWLQAVQARQDQVRPA